MALYIRDVPRLLFSAIDGRHFNLPLDSTNIINWKCMKCQGIWRESVNKRNLYTNCPKCEPNSKRKSKVNFFISDEISNGFTCNICLLSFDNKKLELSCPECKYSTCKECLKKFIILNTPKCINQECSHLFSRKFLIESFGDKWLSGKNPGEYEYYRIQEMINIEKSKIQETLNLLPLYEKKRNLASTISRLSKQIDDLQIKISTLRDLETIDVHSIENSYHKIRDYRVKHAQKVQERIELNAIIYGDKIPPKVEKYIQGCPTIGCKGLINDEYFCNVCRYEICKDCRIPLTQDHVCKPEDIESIKNVQMTTMPCPKCNTPIYKISGCDQMFCTLCRTAFSWKSGKIEYGNIHNPHYFEQMRNSAVRNTVVINHEIENLPTYENMIGKLINLPGDELETLDRIYSFSEELSLNKYRDEIKDSETHLKNLRFHLLRGKMDEHIWSKKVYKVYRDIDYTKFLLTIFTKLQRNLIEPTDKLHNNSDNYSEFIELTNKLRLDINDEIIEDNRIHRKIEKYIFRKCNKGKPVSYPINNNDIEYNIFLGIDGNTKFTDIHGNIIMIKDLKNQSFDLDINKIRITTFHEYKYFFEIILILEEAIIL